MSAALAYKDDWPEAAKPEPPRRRPGLYLAYSRRNDGSVTTTKTYDAEGRVITETDACCGASKTDPLGAVMRIQI